MPQRVKQNQQIYAMYRAISPTPSIHLNAFSAPNLARKRSRPANPVSPCTKRYNAPGLSSAIINPRRLNVPFSFSQSRSSRTGLSPLILADGARLAQSPGAHLHGPLFPVCHTFAPGIPRRLARGCIPIRGTRWISLHSLGACAPPGYGQLAEIKISTGISKAGRRRSPFKDSVIPRGASFNSSCISSLPRERWAEKSVKYLAG